MLHYDEIYEQRPDQAVWTKHTLFLPLQNYTYVDDWRIWGWLFSLKQI